MNNNITIIKALGDNLIYLYKYDQGSAFVIDPGDAAVVLNQLQNQNLKLTHILITHHHWDHTGGAENLKRKTGCIIVNPDAITEICNTKIESIQTPGHTRDSICYFIEQDGRKFLFTGDTLFIGGCGRLFECDARTMWQSLQILSQLPPDTLVYPGHEYTVENYEFALSIAPNHKAFAQQLAQAKVKLQQINTTAPSTIQDELGTNIFLLAGQESIKKALQMPTARDYEVFAELRRRKNSF